MLLELRYVLNVPASDVTWLDTTLLGYLEEGQDKFCEDTGYFVDATNYSITLVADIAVYNIPDRIIQILSIWDGTRKLRKMDADADIISQPSGSPRAWKTDKETGLIVFDRTPGIAEDTDVFILQVWRYSQYALTNNDIDGFGTVASPELPTRLQRACIEWAAYKAFNHHDMEAQDPVKAADHLHAFQMYIRDGHRLMRRYHNIETRVGTAPAYRT